MIMMTKITNGDAKSKSLLAKIAAKLNQVIQISVKLR